MTFPVERDGRAALVALEGEIDLETAAQVREALFDALDSDIDLLVVELDKVTFLSSVGLTILAVLSEMAGERGVVVRIAASTRIALRPIQLTGLDEEIEVFPNRASALRGRPDLAEDTTRRAL